MFDGVPEQFHQFIASSRASSSPLPLPPQLSAFPFHGFDPFPNPNPTPIPHPPPSPPPLSASHHQHHLLHLHHPSLLLHHKDVAAEEEEGKERSLLAMSANFDIEARVDRSMPEPVDHGPWSNEEVVALLRIGSNMENWFPQVTWEHVSRKLAELGFKRSAEKCKEKFEEQTRTSFNDDNHNNINININYSKNNNNYRLLVNELEELYDHHHHENPPTPPEQHQQLHEVPQSNDNDDGNVEKPMEEEDKEEEEEEVGRGGVEGEKMGQNNMEEVDSQAVETTSLAEDEKRLKEEREEDKVAKKRKRWEKFEMFKRFCESVVERLMAQQEEMHNKLLEDMMRRDREMVEKEEAWKKMEMERLNKELDMRAQEQAVAGNRQATIIEFLKGFTSPSCEADKDGKDPIPNPRNPTARVDTEKEPKTPSSTAGPAEDDRPNLTPPPPALVSPNPNSSSTPRNLRTSNTTGECSDTGKRWPREEVLALINLRCTIQGNNEDSDHHQQGAVKAPLWERISQRMSELGYTRSAKRCKEKWENINKYFRKTKDSNVSRKRSADSRTCPYFHQLNALYNQRNKPVPMPEPLENRPSSPENSPSLQDTTQ
ncbi:hypothetical protein CDL15_Pgr001590 [Punica granatum]|uniref:Myb-like domain-containing protein n=1 Tax=Punica granatum TaxID=22663 RepID=A0A218XBD7_PUNGR|nr:hypothetical protein CDL15_Pgr001590 [Punica granatum]